MGAKRNRQTDDRISAIQLIGYQRNANQDGSYAVCFSSPRSKRIVYLKTHVQRLDVVFAPRDERVLSAISKAAGTSFRPYKSTSLKAFPQFIEEGSEMSNWGNSVTFGTMGGATKFLQQFDIAR